jgi:hypothetical protein
VKLRPENPLLLAGIEEAQTSSATVIADFGNDRLPTIHNAFECLTYDEPHCSSSYIEKKRFQFAISHVTVFAKSIPPSETVSTGKT